MILNHLKLECTSLWGIKFIKFARYSVLCVYRVLILSSVLWRLRAEHLIILAKDCLENEFDNYKPSSMMHTIGGITSAESSGYCSRGVLLPGAKIRDILAACLAHCSHVVVLLSKIESCVEKLKKTNRHVCCICALSYSLLTGAVKKI